MHCTNFDHDGAEVGECGNEDFDVTVTAMLTADLSGDETDYTLDLDGFSHEDITLTCKKCGAQVDDEDAAKAATVLILKLEKRFGASMAPFSSYTFEDGTVIHPEQLKVNVLKDVAAGLAYQEAVKHQERYRSWRAVQDRRVEAGEINVADLSVMELPWMQAMFKHHGALLHELSA